MIAILLMTDGRAECLERTIASAEEMMNLNLMARVIHDDSSDRGYKDWLYDVYSPRFDIVSTRGRTGFSGAIRSAWDVLRAIPGLTHIVHLEDDFIFDRRVPLHAMIDLLDDQPEVVQVALQRQAWNEAEKEAGGLFQVHREAFSQHYSRYDDPYIVQRRFFTTNPCVYRRSLLEEDWPMGLNSEGRFSHQLLATGTNGIAGDEIQFAFWGKIEDAPWVHHIGDKRVGVGY